jgi:hypothetical protein
VVLYLIRIVQYLEDVVVEDLVDRLTPIKIFLDDSHVYQLELCLACTL